MPPHTVESPAKKQSKWSPEEDALIIELRGSGMKWDDISKRLPGRSSISCRLHYQNYLERRSEWDEERKNKLARLYERFKPEMWAKVAEEMQVPWRAAEAMHWQLGEADMARRAGVVPFSLNMTSNEPQGPQRMSPTRGHAHSQSQGSLPRDLSSMPSPRYSRGGGAGGGLPPSIPPLIPPPPPTPTGSSSSARPLASRRDSLPPRPPAPFGPLDQQPDYVYGPGSGIGLAPIQTTNLSPRGQSSSSSSQGGGGGGMLPSLAELTTGVSPYSTPAYSVGGPPPPPPSASPQSATASPGGGAGPGPLLPALSPYPPPTFEQQQQQPVGGAAAAAVGKRRASPGDVGGGGGVRETSRRRHLHHPRAFEEAGGVGEYHHHPHPPPPPSLPPPPPHPHPPPSQVQLQPQPLPLPVAAGVGAEVGLGMGQSAAAAMRHGPRPGP
ncbi:hypothetical protein VTK56DRAFT_9665 [Thermocarpiscus australiensis]